MAERLAPRSSVFEKTSRWFERANASLLETIPCRQGCSHCCIGLFPITILDRQDIQRGLQTLPDEQRQRIQGVAAAQVTALTEANSELTTRQFIDGWREEDVDRLIEQFDTAPCPALETDGRCGLYDYRPLVCRSTGIPTDDGACVSGACAVQTAVPLIRLSTAIREEEYHLARIEANELEMLRDQLGVEGEELFLPFAFLPESPRDGCTESA